jgi:hypothetical protein
MEYTEKIDIFFKVLLVQLKWVHPITQLHDFPIFWLHKSSDLRDYKITIVEKVLIALKKIFLNSK